jgi:endonuclease/exonuclease/phosphatase family metal-dependent hydrolase
MPEGRAGTDTAVTVASYNIHAWVGTDGVCNSDRTVRVIRGLGAEIVGLQEVTNPPDPDCAFGTDYLERATGMQAVSGTTLLREEAEYGNVLLTTRPVVEVRRHDLSLPGREPRGVLDVVVTVGGSRLRVLVTHLGVKARERRRQVDRLLFLLGDAGDPVILMGDLNEWVPWRAARRRLSRWFGPAPAPHTYPSRHPLFPLDRIFLRPREALLWVRSRSGGEAKTASDHLPLTAGIELQPAALKSETEV